VLNTVEVLRALILILIVSALWTQLWTHCMTLTFAERNRLSFLLSGNKPLSAN